MIDMLALFAAALLQAAVPPIRTIDKGAMSEVSAPRQVAVGDPQAWKALWATHAGRRALPDVDFSKEMVVAVFLGTRQSAGFAVNVVGYRADGANLIVEYRETAPSRDEIAAQVLTAPYHLAAIPKAAGTITFVRLRE